MAKKDDFTEITVPDSLLIRKAGPKERKSPNHIALAEALRSKEPISEWYSASKRKENAPELCLREALTRTLSEHCYFGYVQENSKNPQSYPKPGSNYSVSAKNTEVIKANGTYWAASEGAPRSGNWSVIPKLGSRIMIFDLDIAKSKKLPGDVTVKTTKKERLAEVRESLGFLSKLLSVDLRNTYSQLSPSGGLHLFVLLPEGVDPKTLPSSKISNGMRSIAGVPENEWSTKLKGDIRSGASNGFILMAGSTVDGSSYRPTPSHSAWYDFKNYMNGRKLKLTELSTLAVERLQQAKTLDLELKKLKRSKAGISKATKQSKLNAPISDSNALSRNIQAGDYTAIISRINSDFPMSFHSARAQLYKALSCCGSAQSIVDILREAGFARDTYGNRELTDEELFDDIESMDRRGLKSTRCGTHCRVASSDSVVNTQRVSNLLNTKALESIEDGSTLQSIPASMLLAARNELDLGAQRGSDFGVFKKRNPRAFDYPLVVRALLGERLFTRALSGESLSIAGFRRRALTLAIGYFGPLFSSGAPNVIASHSELTKLFGYTVSQVKEALRLLRETKVIALVHRQVTGRTSTYGPGDERFFDTVLERKMRVAWRESELKTVSGLKSLIGGFFDFTRSSIVRPDGTVFHDRYLSETAGELKSLLLELNLQSVAVMAPAYTVVTRYLGKAAVRHNTVRAVSDKDKLEAVSAVIGSTSALTSDAISEYYSVSDSSLTKSHTIADKITNSPIETKVRSGESKIVDLKTIDSQVSSVSTASSFLQGLKPVLESKVDFTAKSEDSRKDISYRSSDARSRDPVRVLE